MTDAVYLAARVFDGAELRRGAAVWVEDGRICWVGPAARMPGELPRVDLGDAVIAPGFVDLQVNGGGGVFLNHAPNVAGLEAIAAAHAQLGTLALLPTLISDRPEVTAAAIEAAAAACAAGLPGIAGLHLEGPHLAPARTGAHDPALLRPMEEADCTALCAAAAQLPALIVTVAPEAVRPDQIARLTDAGAVVALGHTEAAPAACAAAAEAGAQAVTHLFNGMPPLANRAPGPVAAALEDGRLSAGLIADAVHVAPAAMRLALRAKRGPGRIFLVSDAMAVAGTAQDGCDLQGRRIHRRDGRLTLADGTLAGADLDICRALQVMTGPVGLPRGEALAMATSIPAALIGRADLGRLAPGGPADFIALDPDLALRGVWRGGQSIR